MWGHDEDARGKEGAAMRYGSVCSEIEAATVAWRHLGWECAFVSEVEPFAHAAWAYLSLTMTL